MKISVIMPVYNEKHTLEKILEKVRAVDLEKEIIMVDDGSTDGTREMLREMKLADNERVFFHEKNMGKGAALRTGFNHATGDFVMVQDADLEYDPQDYFKMLKPVQEGHARVVYGSRFTGERQNIFLHHWVGNRFLTLVANILFNTTLSDMETCYKLIETDIIKSIKIKSNKFTVEPEMTAKILKKKIRIYEVPISYYGREYSEGKKITWRDGFGALAAIIWYRFFN
jgi:glycosyltransferase involved in cell wall biosynthesis